MSIPTKDSLLVPYSTNFDARLNAHYAQYGIAEQQAANYTLLHTPYVEAYNALTEARADGTRSKALAAAKDRRKEELLKYARQLYVTIAANPQVDSENKVLLGIHLKKQGHTPPGPVTQRPATTVVSVNGYTIEATIFDPEAYPSIRRPAGTKGAFVHTYCGQTYPSDPKTWQFHGLFTRSQVQIVMDDTIPAGTHVWICAAWVGSEGETGPVSMPVSTFLQGGGTAQTTVMKVAA